MSIERTKQGIRVEGELTFESAAQVYHALKLEQIKENNLVVDLSGVTTSDSAALAVMLEWVIQAKAHNKTVEYMNIPDQLMLLIEMANLKNLFKLESLQ